jgi:hypothetical protein
MKQYTPVLLFIAAALFAVSGGISAVSGHAERSVGGFAMAVFWLIFGLDIRKKAELAKTYPARGQ